MEWRDVERFFYVAQKEGVAEAFRRARRKWSAGAEGAAEYARWIVLSEPGEAELSAQRHERLKGPLISFLCPAYNTKESHARALVHSLLAQTYPRWELCVADGSSVESVRRCWQELARIDGRIRVIPLKGNDGIAANTAAAAAQQTGAEIDVLLHESYPGVVNHDGESGRVRRVAAQLLGETAVTVLESPTMTTEDFGYFLDETPGSFYHIGAGCENPLHSPQFFPDARAAVLAAALHAAIAADFLENPSA